MFFLVASFVSGWITFYAAYSAIVISTPYLKQFTAWLLESAIISAIVSAFAAVSFFFDANVNRRNYIALAVICLFEFGVVFWFFVAFFGV